MTDATGAVATGMVGKRSVGASTETLNCCRMISLTAAELSTPQYWQTNWIGFATVCAVTSSAYLTPHGHLILSSMLWPWVEEDYTLCQQEGKRSFGLDHLNVSVAGHDVPAVLVMIVAGLLAVG